MSVGLIVIGLSAVVPDLGRARIDPRFAPIDAWQDDDGSWVFVEPDPDDPVYGFADRFDPRGEVRLVYVDGSFPDLRWYGIDRYRLITMYHEFFVFTDDGSLSRRDARGMAPPLADAFVEYLQNEIVPASLERNDEVWMENESRRTRARWERRWVELRPSSLAWTFVPGLLAGGLFFRVLVQRSVR